MSVDAHGSITLSVSQFKYKEKHVGGNRFRELQNVGLSVRVIVCTWAVDRLPSVLLI